VDNKHTPIFSTRYSIASARPSLQSSMPQPGAVVRQQSGSLNSQSATPQKEESGQSRARKALFQVETIDDDEDSDDWELEFLRKSQTS
jgi:hypothetical protein